MGFCKKIIDSLPDKLGKVTDGTEAECGELARCWDGGPVLKCCQLSRYKAEVEVLQDFMAMVEEQGQIQEVLSSSIEDYVD